MSNSSSQMSNFRPVDSKLVMMGETEVTVSCNSALSDHRDGGGRVGEHNGGNDAHVDVLAQESS